MYTKAHLKYYTLTKCETMQVIKTMFVIVCKEFYNMILTQERIR